MKGVRTKLLPLLLLSCIVSIVAQGGLSGVSVCDISNGGCEDICTESPNGAPLCSCSGFFQTVRPDGSCIVQVFFVVIYIFYCPIVIVFFPLGQLSPDVIANIPNAEAAAEQLIAQQVFNGLSPVNVTVNLPPVEPFVAEVEVSFAEGSSPLDQALIVQEINEVLASAALENAIATALGLPSNAVTIDNVLVNLQCGTSGARNISSSLQFEIQTFLENCPCNTTGRSPSCSPQDIVQSTIVSLLGSVEFLMDSVERQEAVIEQQGMRLDALDALLVADGMRLDSLQSMIQELFGVDSNLTGLSSTLLDGIQDLRNDVQGQQNQIQMLQGQNQLQETRLDDLDSLSSTGWALGIAGTVFGALAVLLLVVICVCLCCPGCRMPFFTSPRPLGPALPVSPIARPVINGPICRRPQVPAACNMARFGVGRMQAGPIYGGYYR